jgi:hypothetical protein
MKRLVLAMLVLTACVVFGCQPDDTSGDNNGGWLDTGVDGADDVADDDTAADTTGDADAADPHWSACTVPTDCVLRASGCCGVCGQPELGDMDAVNQTRTDAHFDDVCPEPQPCPDCPQQFNPYLIATCESQTCTAYDTRQESFTECTQDSDCRLRTRECCECGGTTDPYMLIAIANSGEQAYSSLVCEPGMGCPECAPVYPDNAEAVCGESGHCEVEVTQ